MLRYTNIYKEVFFKEDMIDEEQNDTSKGTSTSKSQQTEKEKQIKYKGYTIKKGIFVVAPTNLNEYYVEESSIIGSLEEVKRRIDKRTGSKKIKSKIINSNLLINELNKEVLK